MVSMNVPLEDRAIIHKKGGIRAALSPTRKIRQQFTTLKHILMAKSKSYLRTLPRTNIYQKQELTV